MKHKIILLLGIFCLTCLTIKAQDKSKLPEKRKKEFIERFQKYRKQHDEFHLTFILKKLELKEKKEKEVTLVYKELLKKRRAYDSELYAAEFSLRLKCFQKKKLKEQDFSKFNKLRMQIETNKNKTEIVFYSKFQKILSEKKIYTLYSAEKKYKADLLNKIRKRGNKKNNKTKKRQHFKQK